MSIVVIITGASEGIGRALAKCFARDGARLVLAARNEERLRELTVECKALGAAGALALKVDVTRSVDCRMMVERTIAEFGQLDILVNNAGITMWAKFSDMTDPSLASKVMDVNFMSSVYGTYFALPHLIKTRGRLVVVSSLAGLIGVPGHSVYGASKHALHGFINSLRIEVAPAGVSCTIVAPDFVVTEIHDRGLAADGKKMGRRLDPKRYMSAETCAELIHSGVMARKRLVLTSLRGHLAARFRDWIPNWIADRLVSRHAKGSTMLNS
jgi:short-subunit dehydrogenase